MLGFLTHIVALAWRMWRASGCFGESALKERSHAEPDLLELLVRDRLHLSRLSTFVYAQGALLHSRLSFPSLLQGCNPGFPVPWML